MRFDYILSVCTLPHTSLILVFFYVFSCRRSFLVVSNLFNDGCSADCCDFGVLVRGGE